MITKLHTYRCTCDRCGKRTEYSDTHERLPDGWGYVAEYDCGLTGYTRQDTYCPKCYAKTKK